MTGTPAWPVAHGRTLPLDRPRLMGVLNVTPDSFSDGGEHARVGDAVARAHEMRAQGADIVDIGGESTRPGAARVSADEQIERTIPVIQRLARDGFDGLISIDTTLEEVARRAIDEGAHILNDVSGGNEDAGMLPLASSTGAGLVLMHRATTPERDSFSNEYERKPAYDGGVTKSVRTELERSARRAIDAGVERERIVIDPGLGFGKSVEQNYELIRETPRLMELGFPVLSASSRESFLGAVTGQEIASERLEGTLAVSLAHARMGVRLFRVHDVAPHARAFAAYSSIWPWRAD